jgi:hypothetical protein
LQNSEKKMGASMSGGVRATKILWMTLVSIVVLVAVLGYLDYDKPQSRSRPAAPEIAADANVAAAPPAAEAASDAADAAVATRETAAQDAPKRVPVNPRGIGGGLKARAGQVLPNPAEPSSAPSTSSQTPAEARFSAESGKIDGLIQGSAAVSAPSTAKQGDSFPVFLRVSPEKLAVVMQTLKDEFPENQTVKGKPGVKLTPRMIATVTGFGFEIAPKDGQVQAVSDTEATTWTWQVKAVDPGIRKLAFTLSGTLTVEGKEVPRDFFYYQQDVNVDVAGFNPWAFLEQNWQWLVTTLAIPAIGALWAVFTRPKGSEGKRPKSLTEKLRERRRSSPGRNQHSSD